MVDGVTVALRVAVAEGELLGVPEDELDPEAVPEEEGVPDGDAVPVTDSARPIAKAILFKLLFILRLLI